MISKGGIPSLSGKNRVEDFHFRVGCLLQEQYSSHFHPTTATSYRQARAATIATIATIPAPPARQLRQFLREAFPDIPAERHELIKLLLGQSPHYFDHDRHSIDAFRQIRPRRWAAGAEARLIFTA